MPEICIACGKPKHKGRCVIDTAPESEITKLKKLVNALTLDLAATKDDLKAAKEDLKALKTKVK